MQLTQITTTTSGQSIEEIITELGDVIAWAKAEKSSLGYFAALYRKVTIAVRDGIARGQFEDNLRMERLDVIFARRYLDALNAYRKGEACSSSWVRAFEDSKRGDLLIIQHLLLGMNAHINLDLGIAAAQVAPGERIDGLKNDFNLINSILKGLVDEVQREISKLSPVFWLLDWLGGKKDERIVDFAMVAARDAAWFEAQRLAAVPRDYQSAQIELLDAQVEGLARYVEGKKTWMQRVCRFIARFESRDIMNNIDVLTK